MSNYLQWHTCEAVKVGTLLCWPLKARFRFTLHPMKRGGFMCIYLHFPFERWLQIPPRVLDSNTQNHWWDCVEGFLCLCAGVLGVAASMFLVVSCAVSSCAVPLCLAACSKAHAIVFRSIWWLRHDAAANRSERSEEYGLLHALLQPCHPTCLAASCCFLVPVLDDWVVPYLTACTHEYRESQACPDG